MNTPKKIELIVRALVTCDEKVLLCRNLAGGHCYLPGGHVEPGETARQALARELAEEAGLQVRVGDLVFVHEHRFEQEGRPRHELNLVFHVELGAGQISITSREARIAFEWAPLAALEGMTFVPRDMTEPVRHLSHRIGATAGSRGHGHPTATFLNDEM